MRRIDPTEERRLVGRAREGDMEAYENLVRTFERPIYFLCLRMAGAPQAADDLAQETFIRAYGALSGFKEGRDFYAWLRRIAVNTALTALQVTRTQNRVALDAELREEASLDQAIEQNELILQMQKEIAGLPEEQRTVFVLRTQQEMSYEEIAAALNLSLGTVMSRLSRARSRLKESLREYI